MDHEGLLFNGCVLPQHHAEAEGRQCERRAWAHPGAAGGERPAALESPARRDRRSEDEMPARKEEIGHAKEEGIELRLLNNPTRILGNDKGWVNGMECIKMELGEPDASGRRSPVEIKGSEYVLDVDMVVMAIGQGPNPLLKQTTPELETNKRGNIVANEEGATSIPGVFAGGDIVTGAATVISAMGAGKKAALAIDEYLSKH